VLKSFAKTLAYLREVILAYYDFNDLASGKIKTIHKVAYGYRDLKFLKLHTSQCMKIVQADCLMNRILKHESASKRTTHEY